PGAAATVDRGRAARARPHADRRFRADLAAARADHAVRGQAAVADARAHAPGRRQPRIERTSLTGSDAVAAEGAFAAPRIEPRQAAAGADQHLLRTGGDAVAAAGAGVGEAGFVERPRRAQGRRLAEASAQQGPAAQSGMVWRGDGHDARLSPARADR